ncbi:MAG: hypothetical protein GY679_01320 [Mycoplasma sp.]|nr:hypothetical protein [Mycoplasma sp.]
MSYKLARQVLAKETDSFATTNSIPVAWENVSFEPATVDEYLEFFPLFGNNDDNFLVGGSKIIGVLQINVYTPINDGSFRNFELLNLLETAFDNQKFVDNTIGYKVNITNFQIGRADIQNNKYRQVVDITFQSWR